MVLHQDLAVLRSCLLVLSLFSCSAVFFSIMPSCFRSTLGARAPQWEGGCYSRDARPRECRGSRQSSAGVGRRPTQSPPPPTTTSRVTHDWRCRPVRKVSPFLELGLWSTWRWIIAPVDDCDGQVLSAAWFSPPCHGRAGCRQDLVVCPCPESRSSPLPSVGVVLELSSPGHPGRSKGPQLSWSVSDFKGGCPLASGTSSIGVTRSSSTLLLDFLWLWKPRHLVHAWQVASGVWQRRRPALMTRQRTHFIEWSTSPPRFWLTHGGYVGAIVCALEADKCVWSRKRSWATCGVSLGPPPYQSDGLGSTYCLVPPRVGVAGHWHEK